MPVVKIENISEDCTLGLWKITENTDALYQESVLSENEILEYEKISNLKRKKEWLAVRVLLKTVMKSLNIPYKGTIKDDASKPFLVHNGFHISLAHSFPYAGVIVNRMNPCGIDIEKPKPALYFIASKFLSDKECEYVAKKPMDLCLAWAAKEVMFKLCGKKNLSFRDHLLIEPYECQARGKVEVHINHENRNGRVPLEYELVEETLICYSV